MELISKAWTFVFSHFNIFEVHPAHLEVLKFMIRTNAPRFVIGLLYLQRS